MNLVNIIVNYKNEEEIKKYVEELNKQNHNFDFTLVIVDQLEESNIEYKVDFTIYRYFVPQNLGYMQGAIYGYQMYKNESKEKIDWVVISNSDLEFDSQTFMTDFFTTEYDKDTWVIAPSVYNTGKQTYDNPKYLHRIPKKKIQFVLLVHRFPIISKTYLKLAASKAKQVKSDKKSSTVTYAVQGCYFAVKEEMMTLCLNEPFKGTLFAEENYISEMALKYNKKVFYNSQSEVIHHENVSTGGLNYRLKAKFFYESHKYILNTFYK